MPPGAQPSVSPSATPPAATPSKPPKKNRGEGWDKLIRRARIIGSIAALFIFLVAVGGVGGYVYFQLQPKTPDNKPSISTLSPSELQKLTEVGSSLGNTGQTLNIGANSLFRGKVDVTGDLNIGGRLNANGPVTLSQLNITGTTAAVGLSVGSNLTVSGNTTLQQNLTVGQLATFTGGINVGGNASFNALNASSIAVRTISISGPLTIGHLSTQGTAPVFVPGTSVGGGGTASISGNDTAGTLNFNTGNAPPAGVLGTITFRAAYGSTVHVLLSPLTGAAASTPAYVTRSSGGFQVHTDSPPPAGSTLSYDYFVTQ
jgi:hypothetical protein